jgi:hypothetical protein
MMSEEPENSQDESEGRHGTGILLTGGLHIIFAGILFLFFLVTGGSDWGIVFPLFFLGVTQAIYIIPAFVIARGKGRTQVAQGLLIGAAITFLLNAACAGYMIWDDSR